MFTLHTLNTEKHQEEGAWFQLCYPGTDTPAFIDKEEKKPARIKMKGLLSKSGKQTVVDARNKAAKAQPNKSKEVTIEDLEDKKIADVRELADLAVDWENILDAEGKEVPFTKEAFYEAALGAHDLRVQCRSFITDQKAFTPA